MRSHFIEHNGKQVFHEDYSYMNVEEFEKEVREVTEAAYAQPLNSMLTITNFTGVLAQPKLVQLIMWSSGQTKPYTRKIAVIGIGSSKARRQLLDMVLKATGQTARTFEDLEEAKDWLTAD